MPRATLREREAALGQRLKDAVAREGDLQARLVQAGEREAALMRKVGRSLARCCLSQHADAYKPTVNTHTHTLTVTHTMTHTVVPHAHTSAPGQRQRQASWTRGGEHASPD